MTDILCFFLDFSRDGLPYLFWDTVANSLIGIDSPFCEYAFERDFTFGNITLSNEKETRQDDSDTLSGIRYFATTILQPVWQQLNGKTLSICFTQKYIEHFFPICRLECEY